MSDTGLSRRHALLLAMSAISVGMGMAHRSVLAATGVTVPMEPMRLTRKLSRGLRDGKAVIVTRQWRVQFSQESRGVSVTGEQTAVSVDAPAALAQLADIEEQRSTAGMFPILLSSDGFIMAAGENTSQASIDAALKTAEEVMVARGIAQASAAEQRQVMAQLQAAGSSFLDQIPGDLFYPSTTPVREVRRVPLGEGLFGEFEVSWEASVQAEAGLLEEARREVITRIGESERRSSEDWRLEPV
ncbi:MAG: hypothetical protein AAFQ21_14405 [Pseudomonadota bacterium]